MLGVRKSAGPRHNPDALAALLQGAATSAADWCGDPANRAALAALMASPAYLGRPAGMDACRR